MGKMKQLAEISERVEQIFPDIVYDVQDKNDPLQLSELKLRQGIVAYLKQEEVLLCLFLKNNGYAE